MAWYKDNMKEENQDQTYSKERGFTAFACGKI